MTRTCADGRHQKKYLKEDESVAAPTVSLEGIISTAVMDFYEEREIITNDVLGAFLHSELKRKMERKYN